MSAAKCGPVRLGDGWGVASARGAETGGWVSVSVIPSSFVLT